MAGHKTLLIGTLCTVALICSSYGVLEQASDAAEPKTKGLVPMVYRTADLPIWNESGKGFDHAILIALLKARISTENWNDSHSITPYPQKVSLVVTTSKENHAVIAKSLDELRLERFTRTPEFRRSAK